jgi:hypothetical protein
VLFLITSAISKTAVTGHAFTVQAFTNYASFEQSPGAPTPVGTGIVARDANHVSIGRPPQPVIGGTLAILFGGESAMLLASGGFVLWRRS